MIERGKDDFGRRYFSATCDECGDFLDDCYYIVDFDTSQMLCRDCAFEKAKDKLGESGTVSIDRMFIDWEEDE